MNFFFLALWCIFLGERRLTKAELTGTLCLNSCSGHGKCMISRKHGAACRCYIGWGAKTDITSYRAPDCSSQSCPSGKAWAWVATNNVSSHSIRECSNRGICDHSTGNCNCAPGYTGMACDRRLCPNDCSGHGRCLSMKMLASHVDAWPLSLSSSYISRSNLGPVASDTPWDDSMIFGCLCDSSWPVGLGQGQRQASEWFGPDCSRRHCPTGDDPQTAHNETNCYGVKANGGNGIGELGNLCHVDCSNRGICDYTSGSCRCFQDFYGPNCGVQRDAMDYPHGQPGQLPLTA